MFFLTNKIIDDHNTPKDHQKRVDSTTIDNKNPSFKRKNTLKDNSLKIAEILAAKSTGADEPKIKSSVGFQPHFLPQTIRL